MKKYFAFLVGAAMLFCSLLPVMPVQAAELIKREMDFNDGSMHNTETGDWIYAIAKNDETKLASIVEDDEAHGKVLKVPVEANPDKSHYKFQWYKDKFLDNPGTNSKVVKIAFDFKFPDGDYTKFTTMQGFCDVLQISYGKFLAVYGNGTNGDLILGNSVGATDARDIDDFIYPNDWNSVECILYLDNHVIDVNINNGIMRYKMDLGSGSVTGEKVTDINSLSFHPYFGDIEGTPTSVYYDNLLVEELDASTMPAYYYQPFTGATTAAPGVNPYQMQAGYYEIRDDDVYGKVFWAKDDASRPHQVSTDSGTSNAYGNIMWEKYNPNWKADSNVFRVGFKIKTTTAGHTGYHKVFLMRWNAVLLSMSGTTYRAGDANAADLTPYMKNDAWNDLCYEVDTANQKVNVTVNGVTIYDVNVGSDSNRQAITRDAFENSNKKAEMRLLEHGSTPLEVYFDDLFMEETGKPLSTAPVMNIVKSSIENGKTDVPTTAGSLTVTFDQFALDPQTIGGVVFAGLNSEKSAALSKSVSGNALTVTYGELEPGTTYWLKIPAALRAKNGAHFTADTFVSFTTAGDRPLFHTEDDFEKRGAENKNYGRAGSPEGMWFHGYSLTANTQYGIEKVDDTQGYALKVVDSADRNAQGFMMWKMARSGQAGWSWAPQHILRVGFKFKTDVTGHRGYNTFFTILNSMDLMTINEGKYIAGNSVGQDISEYVVNNDWNEVTFDIDPATCATNLTITNSKGTTKLYNVKMSENEPKALPAFAEMRFLNKHGGTDGNYLTAYFDDLLLEELAPVVTLDGATADAKPSAGGTVNVTGYFTNTTGSAQAPKMIAAVYDQAGTTLRAASVVTANLATSGTAQAQVTLPDTATATDIIRVFAFEDLASMKPLGASVTATVAE